MGEDLAALYALESTYVLYENDELLTQKTKQFFDIFDIGEIYYRFDSEQGNSIYFSSTDGEDSRLHTYELEAEALDAFWDPFGQYRIDMQVCGVDEDVARAMQVDMKAQFNRNNFPFAINDLQLQYDDVESSVDGTEF